RDNAQMIAILRRLVARGNTVIVVEHDPATILAADWIVDIGPRAGREGGQVMVQGPLQDVLENGDGGSVTLEYLRRK
ncbi:MAG: hypothetical protein AAF570_27715, partial [Bacteroidota bacterium]